MNTQILSETEYNIALCAQEILGGGVVAFPTETVYGLGANAYDEFAVKKIYKAKGRPSDNPLICHVSSIDQIDELAYITPAAEKLINAFMPGPLTVVLKKKPCVPDVVTGGLDTVGIRMPNHSCALRLISACNVPLCAPSANTSTRPSPTTAEHVLNDLNGKIRYILDGGACNVGIESTIVDCINNVLLRKGGLPKESIEQLIGKLGVAEGGTVALCPGMKYKHYSPVAEVYLALPGSDMKDKIAVLYDSLNGKKVILSVSGGYGDRKIVVFKDKEEYARKLFASFRQFDKEGYDAIICEGVTESGLGNGLMNRLTKASGGKII